MNKTRTDLHWNDRALNEKNHEKVNIADTTQRDLETNFIIKHLNKNDSVLEIGCGNGFLTNILKDYVNSIDAFDYAENMILKAKETYSNKKIRFFHDNLLNPKEWNSSYDVIVCVRVLINLKDLAEQKKAIDYMKAALKPGGKLILIEGYKDGFENLNQLRTSIGLEKLKPASINFYSYLDEIKKVLESDFYFNDFFHSGNYDYLTRIVYPALVGENEAHGHSDFHTKISTLALKFNPDEFEHLARLRGFLLSKK